MLRQLRNVEMDDAAERYKLTTLQGHFSTLAERWERQQAEKEEGRRPGFYAAFSGAVVRPTPGSRHTRREASRPQRNPAQLRTDSGDPAPGVGRARPGPLREIRGCEEGTRRGCQRLRIPAVRRKPRAGATKGQGAHRHRRLRAGREGERRRVRLVARPGNLRENDEQAHRNRRGSSGSGLRGTRRRHRQRQEQEQEAAFLQVLPRHRRRFGRQDPRAGEEDRGRPEQRFAAQRLRQPAGGPAVSRRTPGSSTTWR